MAMNTLISAVTSGAALTPVRKRRTRPSHSPIKSSLAASTTSALKYSKPMVLPGSEAPSPATQVYLPTAALEFKEFSFVGPSGNVDSRNVSTNHKRALGEHLQANYNATEMSVLGPFLVIACEGNPPSEDQRPFSVAGLIAIWRTSAWAHFVPQIASDGACKEIVIEPEMVAQIQMYKILPRKVVLYLAKTIFPDCIAISMLGHTMVIELPRMSEGDYWTRLEQLPRSIKGAKAGLAFHNGPLLGNEALRRAIEPKPPTISGARDTNDYVSQDKKFYPGTMIGSLLWNRKLYQLATAGVKVQRGKEERLICPFHCWEKHDEKYPGVFGKTDAEAQRVFAVQQGDKPGTIVGFLRERIGLSDIALAQLYPNIDFENSFMEMDYRPKKFVRADEETRGNEYLLDGYCTGKQKVKGYGYRHSIGRNKDQQTNNVFITLEQGAYLTNKPINTQPPFIRQGICGSVLLKCKDFGHPEDSEDTVMKRGEIVGMMHYVDVPNAGKDYASAYLCFADSFTPLIEAGWKISEVPKE